ncbi:MAG: nucleotidyltransferase family protein [Gammaproteobacteria bacterium]|nr:nucleotidyltransferase family protein [Gammaproteobacteria bacterium]
MKIEPQNCWPTSQQLLLLQAGCLPAQAALTCWEQWHKQVDIQNLEAVSEQLLPLVYCNLQRIAGESVDFNTCKSTYRHTWVDNNLLFHNVSPILQQLAQCGITAVVLKGMAECIYYYEDLGARSMGDVDVLVSSQQALIALDILLAQGWRLVHFTREQITPALLKTRHAVALIKDDKHNLDLHWHLLPELCGKPGHEVFIKHSIPAAYKGISFAVLHPADQLLHIIVHGTKYSPVPLIRWVADAMAILRKTGAEFDWNYLLKQAKCNRFMTALKEALPFLAEHFTTSIPLSVLKTCEKYKPSALESRVIDMKRSWQSYHPLVALWLQNTDRQNYASLPKRLLTFPGFLKSYWNLKSAWSLPFLAGHRMGRHLIRKLRSKTTA